MEQESSSTKRAKPPGTVNSQSQVANCLVDGCDADLSLGREYHRRHKVCEAHSKTPIVTIGGREQRFCQQCSRFHSLVEFDESKRSCRKRLDGHNRRRRKPQPESVASSSNSSHLFLNHPSPSGARFPAFGCAQIIPPSALTPTWPGFIKTENDLVLCSNQRRTESFLKFPFKGIEQQQHQQNHFHSHEFSPISSMPSDPRFLNDRRNLQVVETQGAPSLLSTSPQATEELNLIHRYRNEAPIPPNNSQDIAHGGFNYAPFHQFPQDIKPSVSSGQNHGTTLHFPEMFQHGEGSSSGSGPHHQTLSFRWE